MILKARQKFSWFDRVVLIKNIVLIVGLLMCYLTPFVNPVKFSFVSVCGLFYLFFYLLNILCVIYWLFRNYRFTILSAICLLPGLGHIGLHYRFKSNIPLNPKNPGAVRVMTYNLNSFLGIDRRSSQKGILKLVDSLQPDILNLQELSSRVGGKAAIIDSFKTALHTNYFSAHVFIIANTDTTESAIFSKLPIVSSGTVPAPKEAPETQVIYVDVKNGNKIFRVYCLHLQSTHFEPEEHAAMSDVVHLRGFNFPEIKLIFTKLKVAYKKRSHQVSIIKQYLQRCPYPYIITGDFNDTPSSYAVSQLAKNLKNSFVEKGQGYGITYYRDFPNLQIDYIFASKQFNILNHKVVHAQISDHYPVISDLEIN